MHTDADAHMNEYRLVLGFEHGAHACHVGRRVVSLCPKCVSYSLQRSPVMVDSARLVTDPERVRTRVEQHSDAWQNRTLAESPKSVDHQGREVPRAWHRLGVEK